MIIPTKEEIMKAACNVLVDMNLIKAENFDIQAKGDHIPFVSSQLGTIKVYWELFDLSKSKIMDDIDVHFPNITIDNGDIEMIFCCYEDGDFMISTGLDSYQLFQYPNDDRYKHIEAIAQFVTAVFRKLYGDQL